MKKIAIFGSTGSIGKTTLKALEALPDIEVVALVAGSHLELLEEQVKLYKPRYVCLFDEKKAKELKARGISAEVLSGREGIETIAALDEIDLHVMAMIGCEALKPTLIAIQKGKKIAIASKEVIVGGGHYLQKLAKKHKAHLLPIDSEHSALFQCLRDEKPADVQRLIITASGGPFRNFPPEKLEKVTVADALKHPRWNMGAKITIDSSTLMNKSLEIMEAHYLYDMPPEKIEVIFHPQSIIHSMVEFIDGSIKAILNETDMIYPVHFALTYPERRKIKQPPFDFCKYPALEFYPPDFKKFPAISFAYNALKEGKSYPCFLNAANDVLVERFLNQEISWKGIIERLESLLNRHRAIEMDGIENIRHIDKMARLEALNI